MAHKQKWVDNEGWDDWSDYLPPHCGDTVEEQATYIVNHPSEFDEIMVDNAQYVIDNVV